MDDKQALEDYRVRQFGQPLAKAVQHQEALPQDEDIQPDTARVVAHFDVDAFYCQVEELRRPGLANRPMGVTQKYLIVTCNYPARAAGVRKLMGIKEAQQICPDLVLVSGEDLTPYRQASKSILTVLRRFGVAERLGMDEVMVDVTAEVELRLAQGLVQVPAWHGHVYTAQMALIQDNKHRPMDLRVRQSTVPVVVDGVTSSAGVPVSIAGPEVIEPAWHVRLQTGSAIAKEARAVVKAEAGFRCAAGIACNKMLAKLVGGLHKPDDQTTLPPPEAAAFVASLPARAIPGVGYKLNTELEQRGITTAAELRSWTLPGLTAAFGDRQASFLHRACRGQDSSPVQDKGPPKSITVEDSFKSCTSLPAARHILRILTPDLINRLQEDWQETGRLAQTLTLKFRLAKQGWHRSSSSCAMPGIVNPQRAIDDPQVEAVVNAAMLLLSKQIQPPFQLTLLNIGVTNFQAASGHAQLPSAFSSFLGKRKASDPPPGGPDRDTGEHYHQSARQATEQRRDYGAAPQGPPMSKRSVPAAVPAARKKSGLLDVGGRQRVIIHCDVDCFYCQVERLDDASLQGVPLAVQQFNSGGFVAVSYEARAAGVKCGDGVGEAGRASIQRLKDMGAVSLAEAKKKCPALQIRPMRTDRYRQVAAMVHEILQAHAPGCPVEKASYDDFYLDVTSLCHMDIESVDTAPEHLHIVQEGQWTDVARDLRKGLQLAVEIRQALVKQLGMTISVGVARNKLLARLVGPMHKPDGLSVLADPASQPFLCSQPIQSIPSLRQKLGSQVVQALGITTVGQLAGFSAEDLGTRFGVTTGAFLAALPLAQDDAPVRDRGPQKSIMAERSSPPLQTVAAIEAALQPLAASLLQRLAQDAEDNRRLPTKLSSTCREGYGAPRTRSMPMPAAALAALQRYMASAPQPDAHVKNDHQVAEPPEMRSAPSASNPQLDTCTARAVQPFLHGAMTLLHSFVKPPYNLTRLALGAAFDAARDTDLSATGPRKITSFFAQPPTAKRSAYGYVQLHLHGQAQALGRPATANTAHKAGWIACLLLGPAANSQGPDHGNGSSAIPTPA
ncbi:hypothetical protein WJX84_000515 [Apatococcus fuscideae]|uniref:UmuC domain-containing protein n=1 Tax=Apatococcus fuscideae TaxID=2026836 RepID=A0AAW1TGF9_9CHLO